MHRLLSMRLPKSCSFRRMEPKKWDSRLSWRRPLSQPGCGGFASSERVQGICSDEIDHQETSKAGEAIPPKLARSPGPSASERISGWLAQNGIARTGNESLMEAYARAIGVTVSEIRVYLQR